MDLGIKGKVAIVTGGSSGLGGSISRLFAEEGCHVIVNYIVNEAETLSFVEDLKHETGTRCKAVYGDISVAEDMDNLIVEAMSTFGRLDIVVNSAGVWPTSRVEEMSDDEWRKTVDINLTGTFLLSKRAVQNWLERKSPGRIVNIVSQAAFNGASSGHAHYSSAKAGVVGFTVSLAREVAASGINVNAVAPGMIRTGMVANALDEREDEYLDRIPIGRIAEPREVGYVVLFLASTMGDYITGATIDATGGMLMR